MLYNYASFLSLDPEPLLLRYADGLQARLAEKQAKRPKPPSPRSTRQPTPASLRRLLSSDFFIGGILGLSLVGFVIWGAIRISALRRSAQPSATVPSIAEALRITPQMTSSEVPTASASPTEVIPAQGTLPAVPVDATEQPAIEGTPVATGPGEGSAPVQIYITVLHRAWLRVTVDGEVEFEGRVGPGNAYTFAGEVQIEVLTGNGAALQLFFNQTDLGILGEYGEVVYRLFTKEGMVLPTPTITSTPTPTLAATATPAATEQPPPTPLP
jgi:cytoskeletal protein RodZ